MLPHSNAVAPQGRPSTSAMRSEMRSAPIVTRRGEGAKGKMPQIRRARFSSSAGTSEKSKAVCRLRVEIAELRRSTDTALKSAEAEKVRLVGDIHGNDRRMRELANQMLDMRQMLGEDGKEEGGAELERGPRSARGKMARRPSGERLVEMIQGLVGANPERDSNGGNTEVQMQEQAGGMRRITSTGSFSDVARHVGNAAGKSLQSHIEEQQDCRQRQRRRHSMAHFGMVVEQELGNPSGDEILHPRPSHSHHWNRRQTIVADRVGAILQHTSKHTAKETAAAAGAATSSSAPSKPQKPRRMRNSGSVAALANFFNQGLESSPPPKLERKCSGTWRVTSRVEGLEHQIEEANSTLHIMEDIHDTQRRKVADLEVERARLQSIKTCAEVRKQGERAAVLVAAAEAAIAQERPCPRRRREEYLEALRVHVRLLESRLRDIQSEDSRSPEEASADLADLSRRVHQAHAEASVWSVRNIMALNNLRNAVAERENERRMVKIRARVRIKGSYRVTRMLWESLDDARSIDTFWGKRPEDSEKVEMEVGMRGALLKKMAVSLEGDVRRVREIDRRGGAAELTLRLQTAGGEAEGRLVDLLGFLGHLRDQLERERELRASLNERDMTIRELELSIKRGETEAHLCQEVGAYRIKVWDSLQGSLQAMEAIQREVRLLKVLVGRKDAQYSYLLDQCNRAGCWERSDCDTFHPH